MAKNRNFDPDFLAKLDVLDARETAAYISEPAQAPSRNTGCTAEGLRSFASRLARCCTAASI